MGWAGRHCVFMYDRFSVGARAIFHRTIFFLTDILVGALVFNRKDFACGLWTNFSSSLEGSHFVFKQMFRLLSRSSHRPCLSLETKKKESVGHVIVHRYTHCTYSRFVDCDSSGSASDMFWEAIPNVAKVCLRCSSRNSEKPGLGCQTWGSLPANL